MIVCPSFAKASSFAEATEDETEGKLFDCLISAAVLQLVAAPSARSRPLTVDAAALVAA